MRGRLGILIGFGAGYVMGAKAGRDRYEQLQRLYENLVSSRGFQEATGKAREAAQQGIEQAKGAATQGVSKVQGKIQDKRDEDSAPGSLSVAPPPSN